MTTIDNVLEAAAPQQIANAMTRDYSLLRPFDLQAAMSGEPILWGGQFEPATFVARARKGNVNIIERAGAHAGLLDYVQYAPDEYLRMAPLCWVEGRPVYKGDRLWCKIYNEWVIAVDSRTDGVLNADGHEQRLDLDVRDCAWSAPKVRRVGWINVYRGGFVSNAFATKEGADMQNDARHRVSCIRIVWDEVPA